MWKTLPKHSNGPVPDHFDATACSDSILLPPALALQSKTQAESSTGGGGGPRVNRTATQMVGEAWALPAGTDYTAFFQSRNGTFEALATMYTLVRDTDILEIREAQETAASGDASRLAAYLAFWSTFHNKFLEFSRGPRYRADVVAVLDRMERAYAARFGHKALQPFTEPREVEPYRREDSE
jgi:hypothetical protein